MTDGELLDRFVHYRDEEAFESVVLRHGPMVLRVCREILASPHDAEDAFQATFLVLVRNAETIRDRDSLSRWLYGVAFRISVRAKTRARQRQAQERQGVEMAEAGPGYDAVRSELQPILHTELSRLPAKIREPIILCYLEGHSQEEAARQLRCPLGTLKGRLSKGRELLRSRLSRRGVAVSAILFLMALLEKESSAAISDELLDSTVKAGMKLAAGKTAAAAATARVNRLMQSDAVGPRRMFVVLGLVAVLVVGAGSASVMARPDAAGRLLTILGPKKLPSTTAACH
jgi:RNA polymerase sigma factor (sigma-70 family)